MDSGDDVIISDVDDTEITGGITASARRTIFSPTNTSDEPNLQRPFSPRERVAPLLRTKDDIKLERPAQMNKQKDKPENQPDKSKSPAPHFPKETKGSRVKRKNIRIKKKNNVDQEQVEEGFEKVETIYGTFTVPIYDQWTDEERQRERNSMILKLGTIRSTYGEYDLPIAEEQDTVGMSLRNLKIHYEQVIKHIKARRGASQWQSFLLLFWIMTEAGCTALGMNASGYTLSQWRSYEVYERYLIEMGEMQSFGDGWPPYVMIFFLSLVQALIFILSNYILGDSSIASSLSTFAAGKIAGNPNQEYDDMGMPVSSSAPDPVSGLLSTIGVSGIVDAVRGGISSNAHGGRTTTNKRGGGRTLFP